MPNDYNFQEEHLKRWENHWRNPLEQAFGVTLGVRERDLTMPYKIGSERVVVRPGHTDRLVQAALSHWGDVMRHSTAATDNEKNRKIFRMECRHADAILWQVIHWLGLYGGQGEALAIAEALAGTGVPVNVNGLRQKLLRFDKFDSYDERLDWWHRVVCSPQLNDPQSPARLMRETHWDIIGGERDEKPAHLLRDILVLASWRPQRWQDALAAWNPQVMESDATGPLWMGSSVAEALLLEQYRPKDVPDALLDAFPARVWIGVCADMTPRSATARHLLGYLTQRRALDDDEKGLLVAATWVQFMPSNIRALEKAAPGWSLAHLSHGWDTLMDESAAWARIKVQFNDSAWTRKNIKVDVETVGIRSEQLKQAVLTALATMTSVGERKQLRQLQVPEGEGLSNEKTPIRRRPKPSRL